ncbi:MAG: flagellar M-ring protein FliF [Alphaproteobacteria bacterium]|nr:flagellar M-ring protein FliF [Alphaproteobacteria bacterium]
MNALMQFLLRAGPGRLIAALGITAIVAAGVFTLLFRMGGEEKTLLFADLSPKDAQEIVAKLDAANVNYELAAGGASILVPRSQADKLRIEMASSKSTGSVVGYEIFDKESALGATQFQQSVNRLRALEGELARTMLVIDGVKSARVHLVLPERQLFERDSADPSASIVLSLKAPLSSGQVRAIRNLVAGAVPRLSVQRVTILDEEGVLLASGNPDDPSSVAADGVDARQAGYEERIRKTVQDIVESVVGPGKARVQVAAEMDFNRITQNSETFDPDGRVARKTTTSTNEAQSRDAAPNAATAGRNVPDATGASGGGAGQNAETSSSEQIEYEISKTIKTEVIEGGRLRKLSVAVAVDGVTTPGAAGQPAQWAARDAAELERLTTLVRSAVGYDENRGDRVEVVNMRFAPTPLQGTEAKKENAFDLSKLDPMRGAELLASLIAALAFVFFVLRPLVGGLVRPAAGRAGETAAANGAVAIAGGGGGGAAQLAGPAGSELATLGAANNELNVDLARIRGDVKASSIKQVAEIVQQHPDESVAILRGWLNNAV